MVQKNRISNWFLRSLREKPRREAVHSYSHSHIRRKGGKKLECTTCSNMNSSVIHLYMRSHCLTLSAYDAVRAMSPTYFLTCFRTEIFPVSDGTLSSFQKI
jgi:hypothetical protein